MKVALVHDYINEYGGAERVLEALCELYPDAPIYTAFYVKSSESYERFKNRKIVPSWAHYIPFFSTKLHSPLRFLAPLIWNSFDLSEYDVVISSASWYITKGIAKRKAESANLEGPIEICYCHTPPRWLYGYKTSVEWQKYPIVKAYGHIVGHFMRMYDWHAAQRVDYFIANSKETAARIRKFYRREATVIYPPVDLPNSKNQITSSKQNTNTKSQDTKDYYLVVSRIVGSKGLSMAIEAANELGFTLKIIGKSAGYGSEMEALREKAKENIEFVGFVSDSELVRLYGEAKGFLALAEDEDFGITPVESMLCGTPVIAYAGGGYKETVIDGKTGVLFDEYSTNGVVRAVRDFEKRKFSAENCRKQAEKFSKERFMKEIEEFVNSEVKN